jgi:N-acetylglucosaminyldiphosphoundecaprenol N-acetyl-beta-D-mannosaminyltransferase
VQEQVVPKTPKTSSVLGFPIHLLDDYTGWLVNAVAQGKGCHVVTLNAEMTMQAEQNAALAQVIRQAELIIPDGAGVVLYLKVQGKRVQRCPGIELAESLLQQLAKLEERRSVFFYGGAPGVAQTAAELWQKQLPELTISTQHGYISGEEQQAFEQTLKTQLPPLILVGLGVPRQELWIADHRSLCPNAVWIGVGGSFDIWAGVKTRAPGWLRDNHLEWVYRLYQEPWRWRRMLALPKFVWRSLVYWLS